MNPYNFYTTHAVKNSKHYKRLKEDIRQNGILEPIKYVKHENKMYIVDGHHRILAAKELIIDSVPAEEVSLPYGSYKTVEDLNDWENRS